MLKRPFINIPSENRYHTRKMIKISILKEKTTMNLYRRGLLTDGMKDEPFFAEHLDRTIIANDIGRYFVRKVENIRNEIDAVSGPYSSVPMPASCYNNNNNRLYLTRVTRDSTSTE